MVKNIIIGILAILIIGAGVWYYFSQVNYTQIDKILKNPRAYDGKFLTISGEVTDRTSLLFIKFFKLKDKTGEIIVVTKRTLPSIGSKVRVKGIIQETFAIGSEQMLVFVENSGDEKDTKKYNF